MKPGWKAPAQQALALWVEYVLFPHSHPEDLSGATWNRKTSGQGSFYGSPDAGGCLARFQGYRLQGCWIRSCREACEATNSQSSEETPRTAMSSEKNHFGQATFGGSCVWIGCPGGWQGRRMNRGVELGEIYSNLGWNENVFINLASTSPCCKH